MDIFRYIASFSYAGVSVSPKSVLGTSPRASSSIDLAIVPVADMLGLGGVQSIILPSTGIYGSICWFVLKNIWY
jgi:hypothetical protein